MCLFGSSEKFNESVYETDSATDFICFTDMPDLRSDFWQIIRTKSLQPDPARAAKQRKILPHRFLSSYASSLYIDNTVRLKLSPGEIFERYLDSSPSPFVCFRHPERRCVYEEAREVIFRGFDIPERVERQMEHYRRLGYPADNGLWTGAFLLRRHREESVAGVMDRWFENVCAYSHRDQLSLPVVAWQHQFQPGVIDLDFHHNDILEYPFPPNLVRVPRDFDDETYLRLNPDVRAKKMNPRRHYLFFGAAEGRPFRAATGQA